MGILMGPWAQQEELGGLEEGAECISWEEGKGALGARGGAGLRTVVIVLLCSLLLSFFYLS